MTEIEQLKERLAKLESQVARLQMGQQTLIGHHANEHPYFRREMLEGSLGGETKLKLSIGGRADD